jgi:HK97 family phage major capsid protein
MKDFSAMRSVATIIPTSSGEAMPIPVSDGTAEEGEIVAQNGDPADADPTFAQVDWSAYAYSSKVVTAPEQLLQDSVFDMQAFIFDRVSERLGRITNKHYTIGTGSSQPLGIVAASAAGRVGASGQTATILYNDLVDLSESVDVAYLRNGVGKFMMSQTMRAVIRKLKDDQNLPIFLPGYQLAAGVATDTLMGYELVINNSMATPAASAKTVIFGDFKKYYIRDVVNSLRMNRYDDSAYAKKYQVGFQGWMRTGGTLSDTASVKHYVHAAS